MLGTLELLLDNEYNNAGDLLGIDPYNMDPELLGALKTLNPVARQKVVNTLAKNPAPSKGSRGQMEKHFKELPQHIKDELAKGNLRMADMVFYSIKAADSKTIKLFETQDDLEIGVRNVGNAKLPKNTAMIVSGIILLAGTAADDTKDKMMATAFDKIESFPSIANGQFSLKSNKKTIIGDCSNAVFKTNNNHTLSIGYYPLHNPRIIQDDVLIEMTLDLGTTTGIAANSYVWVGLHGTATIP